MPALVKNRDRQDPDMLLTGRIVKQAENDDGEWCLCQPTHDASGTPIHRGAERYQQWVHVDNIIHAAGRQLPRVLRWA